MLIGPVGPAVRRMIESLTRIKYYRLPAGGWLLASAPPQLLAVRATYNLRPPLHIKYVFDSCREGELRLIVEKEGGPVILETTRSLSMPCEWCLHLAPAPALNGEPLELLDAGALLKNGWLVSKLEFTAENGEVFTRTLRQRLLCTRKDSDREYYYGDNYVDYEQEAGDSGAAILDLIAQYGTIHSVLDVGCAAGLLLKHAADRGLRAEGIDVSSWAIEQANRRLGQPLCRVLNIENATLADFSDRYDAVVLQNVLEHVTDPSRLITLVAGLLRPAGFAYCFTLNADSLLHRALGPDWAGYSDYTHRSTWLTASWLRDAFRKAGFDILHFSVDGVWNDDKHNQPLKVLEQVMAFSAAHQLLQDGWGDFVTIVARRTGD